MDAVAAAAARAEAGVKSRRSTFLLPSDVDRSILQLHFYRVSSIYRLLYTQMLGVFCLIEILIYHFSRFLFRVF